MSPLSRRSHFFAALLALVLGLATAGEPGILQIPTVGPRDTCPVCGMPVAPYPTWAATAVYADGHAHHFDGPKDFFKYLANISHFAPGHFRENITTLAVTDYYHSVPIDAQQAYYVVDSDVLGPMGKELVPFDSRQAAEEFLTDHHGSQILTFGEVTPLLLQQLDSY